MSGWAHEWTRCRPGVYYNSWRDWTVMRVGPPGGFWIVDGEYARTYETFADAKAAVERRPMASGRVASEADS